MYGSGRADLLMPKNCSMFGHYVPITRATGAQGLVCRCPRLGPRVPKAWSQSAHLTGKTDIYKDIEYGRQRQYTRNASFV